MVKGRSLTRHGSEWTPVAEPSSARLPLEGRVRRSAEGRALSRAPSEPGPSEKPGMPWNHGHRHDHSLEARNRCRKGVDMLATCVHAMHMSMIQIRNVPEELHRDLKARAARAGMTLSDYLLDVIRKAAERPEPDALLLRIRERSRVHPSEAPADAVRAEREAR